MNIPLDQLYHFINNVANEIYSGSVIIYRFWPHGSKNINDLNSLHGSESEWYKKTVLPLIWCNDQEPLDYEYYKTHLRQLPSPGTSDFINLLKPIGQYRDPTNLNYQKGNLFEKGLLLHSEKRSMNVEKYQLDNELIPVYYWSHAVIARDWFRYAEHIKQKKQIKKTFLIYNRAWSNTREYRLRFADLLIGLDLPDHCQTSINSIEPELGIHYKTYKFKNPIWQPTTVLEDYFLASTAHSHYSADFDIEDYEATDIEIVLETLFDDSRLHLTEKSLRPIACAQPFILVGTHGSLEYLRSYGFKTFGDVWNESYDLVEDPEERLIAITDLMNQIVNLAPQVREKKLAEAQAIAKYNRQHFFSQEFFDLVINELKTNLTLAFANLNTCNNYTAWADRWNRLLSYPEVIEFLNNNHNENFPTKARLDSIFKLIQSKLNAG